MSLDKLIRIAAKGRQSAWHKFPKEADQNRSGESSEHAEQCAVASYLDFLGVLWFAVPSGELRHIAVASRLQKEGVKRGVPDILVLEPRAGYHGLLLEMKKSDLKPSRIPLWGEGSDPMTWKASGLSEEQWEFLKRAHQRGYLVRVGYGALHAKEIVDGYLRGENVRKPAP